MTSPTPFAVHFAALLALLTLPAHAKTCADHARDMAAAYAAQDRSRAAAIVAVATGDCRGVALDGLGRSAALLHVRPANDPKMAIADRRAIIEVALRLGRPWQAVATAGDIAMTEKRHGDAARFYQEALDDIRNERLNPTPPKVEVIGSLVRKAEAASLLSRSHVARVDRSGAPGGLACQTFRGYTVTKTAVPIEFEFKEPGFKKNGMEAFTEKGRAAVDDLVSFLAKQAPPSIILTGHTDPIGGDDYNLGLSRRRAEAVAALIRSRGYAGEIQISGAGRQQPFMPDDPGAFSQEERHQMDRRVELQRSGGNQCATPSG